MDSSELNKASKAVDDMANGLDNAINAGNIGEFVQQTFDSIQTGKLDMNELVNGININLIKMVTEQLKNEIKKE